MTPDKTLVLVLDDEPTVLRSVERLLAAHGHEVRTFARSEDMLGGGPPGCPACLVLDQNLGLEKGTEVHAELRRRGWELPTVFLTADYDTRTVVRAMRDGADDYLVKPYDPDELVAVVGRALHRAVQALQSGCLIAEHRQRAAALTNRERLIVAMVVSGMLNKQISSELGLALVTVKVHRGRAMRKLGARNAAELARIAGLAGIKLPT